MKAFKILLLLLALGLSVHGQAVNVTANKLKGSATAPSGTCSAQQVQLTTAGTVYVCASGTWASSGGGTTINSTNGYVPYRVNSTTFGNSAFFSNALDSTYLSATSGASNAGLALTVAGGGTNESLSLAGKGTGQVFLGGRAELKDYTTPYNDPSVALSIDSNAKTYLFNMYSNGSLVLALHRTSGNFQLTNGRYGWGSVINTPDTGLTRLASGVVRVDNGSTGAGQLLIGTSTGTADAQLSVYSQSTTRPSLKLRALSGTPGSQNVFESYNAANANTFGLTSDGAVTMGDGAALSNTPLTFNVGRGVNNPYVLGYRVSSIDHLLLGATNSSSTGITSAGIVMLSDKSVSWQANSTWSASATDLSLYRDAANTLAQRNGTNAQTFRIYNTYTSGSNYERLGIQASSNAFFITPEAATGTVRELAVGAAGSVTRIRSSLATPSAPALADGDWWVECSGTSPTRTCSILVRDTGATRTIATSVAF